MTLSIVVPTFNSSNFISKTLKTLVNGCRQYDLSEIVVVSDGSTDKTVDTVMELRPIFTDITVRVIRVAINVGQTNATGIGLALASSDLVLTIDDDLKDDVSSVVVLIEALRSHGLDFVVGVANQADVGRFRAFASELVRRIAVRSHNTPRNFRFSSFCLYDRRFLDRARIENVPNFELGWMFFLTRSYMNVTTSRQPSLRESTNYRYWSLIRTSIPFVRYIAGRVTLVLRFFALAVALVASLTFVAYIANFFVSGRKVPGFASLILVSLANLGLLGIISQEVFLWSRNRKSGVDVWRVSEEVQ